MQIFSEDKGLINRKKETLPRQLSKTGYKHVVVNLRTGSTFVMSVEQKSVTPAPYHVEPSYASSL